MIVTSASGDIATAAAPGGVKFGALRPSNQAKVLGSQTIGGKTYVNLDFSSSGGGVGWALASRGIVPVGGGSAYASGAKAVSTTRAKAATTYTKKTTSLLSKQKTEEQGLINQLKNFISGQEPIPELRARLAQELGIPGLTAQLEPLRQQALRTGQTLLNLPEYVGDIARGQGEARRRLLEETKGAQLERQLRDLAIGQEYFAGQLAGAQGELGQQLTAYGQQFERELVPITTQLDVFGERAAREVSGYTKAFQNELDATLADITRSEQLADDARQRAFELAKMERQYQMERSLISARGSASSAPDKNTIKGEVLSGIQSYRQGSSKGVPNTKEGIKSAILAAGGDPNDPFFKGLYAWVAGGGGYNIGYGGLKDADKKSGGVSGASP